MQSDEKSFSSDLDNKEMEYLAQQKHAQELWKDFYSNFNPDEHCAEMLGEPYTDEQKAQLERDKEAWRRKREILNSNKCLPE